jgi:hypothetical protein
MLTRAPFHSKEASWGADQKRSAMACATVSRLRPAKPTVRLWIKLIFARIRADAGMLSDLVSATKRPKTWVRDSAATA